MSNNIIGTDKFRDNLNSWLFKSDQASSDYLYRNKSSIPSIFKTYGSKLYRGMLVDQNFIDKINTTGIIFNTHTSWSKDISVAKKFIKDPKFSIASKKDGIAILLEKTFTTSQQILDIDAFISFMGVDRLEIMGYDETNLDSASKEKEVLIAKGILLKKKDMKILG
jgi:hypothetical protein